MMQGGEVQAAAAPDDTKRGQISEQMPAANAHSSSRERGRNTCPLNKLSVRLLDTYNNINQRYYAQKGREAKKKKKRARYNSKEYDYQVVEGAYLGEKNRYKIDKEIGKGSFGKVVRAYDSIEKEWVAIKIVKKKKAFLRQAETEIRILKALQDQTNGEEPPKIVAMKHYFKHEKHQCLVFELLYRNLYELLIDTQHKGVSLNLVRKFGKQILQTLNFLRKRGVIHCDLKPENVLMRLKNRSHIKVIDFGSACFASEKAFTYIQSRFYRAPEVLLGIEYSYPIDMWSLGCMLVEMHTGKPLFPGRNEQDQVCKQVEVLGVPPDWMIESGKYGSKHFTKQRDGNGKVRWVSSSTPFKHKFNEIMEEARRLNTGKRGHGEQDYARFENLLKSLLAYDFRERITPEIALRHHFFCSFTDSCTSTEVSYLSRGDRKSTQNSVDSTSVAIVDGQQDRPMLAASSRQPNTNQFTMIQKQGRLASSSMEVEIKEVENNTSSSSGMQVDIPARNTVGSQTPSFSTTRQGLDIDSQKRAEPPARTAANWSSSRNYEAHHAAELTMHNGIRSTSCNSGTMEPDSKSASPMVI